VADPVAKTFKELGITFLDINAPQTYKPRKPQPDDEESFY
jgi:hypothetical protein